MGKALPIKHIGDAKLLADRIALLEGDHVMLENPFTRAELLEVYKLAASAYVSRPSRGDVLREVEQRIHDCYNLQKASAWPHCDGVARAKLIVRAMIDEANRSTCESELSEEAADAARYRRIRDGLTTDDFQKLLEMVDDGSWLGAGKAFKQGASLDVAIDSLPPQNGKS